MTNELIQVENDKPMTTSLIIAEKFNKRHDNILRSIQQKKHLFTQLNFEPSEYVDSTGRKLPMYLLDRDFTTFLIMGFTGAKADEWKIKYINAFNEMERLLQGTPTPISTDNRLTIAQTIIEAPKDRLSYITALYPEYFNNTEKQSLEYIVDQNSSYTKWMNDLQVDKEWICTFPTSDIYNSYLTYCKDYNYRSMGKKTFYKTIELDFQLRRSQHSDGFRYFS